MQTPRYWPRRFFAGRYWGPADESEAPEGSIQAVVQGVASAQGQLSARGELLASASGEAIIAALLTAITTDPPVTQAPAGGGGSLTFNRRRVVRPAYQRPRYQEPVEVASAVASASGSSAAIAGLVGAAGMTAAASGSSLSKGRGEAVERIDLLMADDNQFWAMAA